MTNILTLHLDSSSQAFFNKMREQYYPSELNQIAAHLTLFHMLPDTGDVSRTLAQLAADTISFSMHVTALRSLGRGVAYTLASLDLQAIHTALSVEFKDDLSAQDRQRFQPHVVVQNKATPERAKLLLSELRASFTPFTVQAEGLDLWHYLGGPWELAETFSFVPNHL